MPWTAQDHEEEKGINIDNEHTLHNQLKDWYSKPGDRLETKVDGFIIDILRGKTCIEVQTGNFSAIRNKLRKLTKDRKVVLIHPIAVEKWIVQLDYNGEENSRRRSPKRGRLLDVFDQLVYMPDLIRRSNFTLCVFMVKIDELRVRDGKGSWRRGGVSIVDRRLLEVVDEIHLKEPADYLDFMPDDLEENFTNRSLGERIAVTPNKSRKITYTLRAAGLIEQVGKSGNAHLFRIVRRYDQMDRGAPGGRIRYGRC